MIQKKSSVLFVGCWRIQSEGAMCFDEIKHVFCFLDANNGLK